MSKTALVWFFLAAVTIVLRLVFQAIRGSTTESKSATPRDWSTMNDPEHIREQAYAEMDIDRQNAIEGFKRLQEVQPDDWEASAALGISHFDKDNELSYQNLHRFYQQVQSAQADITSPEFEDMALGMYMAGYHYHKRGNIVESSKLKSAAMKSNEFRRDFGEFRMRFNY